jgi:hypothetical protein
LLAISITGGARPAQETGVHTARETGGRSALETGGLRPDPETDGVHPALENPHAVEAVNNKKELTAIYEMERGNGSCIEAEAKDGWRALWELEMG